MPPFVRANRLVSTAVTLVIAATWLLALPDSMKETLDGMKSVFDVLGKNPIAAIGFVFTIAILMVINWDLIEKHLLGRTKKRWASDKELGDELYGWLRGQRHTMTDIDDASVELPKGEALAFAFTATDEHQRPVTVLKIASDVYVLLQGQVVATGEHQGVIHAMTEGQRLSMVEDIALEL